MTYVLALDQGTSSSRGIVFDADGRVTGVHQLEFGLRFPADGWVEQDPEVLWQTTIDAGRGAIDAAGVPPAQIGAIGITNQRETTLLWDRETGEVLHPAIVWQDRRTAEQCEHMEADGLGSLVRDVTGLVIDPYFSSTKLAWLLEHVPGARARAERGELCFGTVDGFLISRLTGGRVHITDATNASRTQLFDIRYNRWSDDLLDYFGVPRVLMPEVADCVHEFGIAQAEWFGAPIPILGCAGDQQAALVGQGCVQAGMTKSTYGTGCFVINNTGETIVRSNNRLLATIGYRVGGETTYALEGSIFVAGQLIQWLRDRLGLIGAADESAGAAARTKGDTQGVYIVPAFTGLGAPHWNARARGLITGLTLDSTRDHIVTAGLHSVAYQTRELLDAMAADGAPVHRLRVDGGMVVNDELCQFIADILGVPVERPVVTETTALGAALLAAVGAGEASGLGAIAARWQLERTFEPAMAGTRRSMLLEGWRHAVNRTLLH